MTLASDFALLLEEAGYSPTTLACGLEGYGSNLCVIDLGAIASNLEAMRKHLSPGCRVMALVKAHAYGSDGATMARFFYDCGVDIVGVAYVSEGIALRRAGIDGAIFAIHATPQQADAVAAYQLEVGVGSLAVIEALAAAAARQRCRIKVHLHIDTGMKRFGCPPAEAVALARKITVEPALELVGMMTHCAVAEDPASDDITARQAALFDKAVEGVTAAGIEVPWRHIANSSAALRFFWPRYNMVRLGLSLWGYYASSACREVLALTPALTLLSQIQEIHYCCRGDTVSYGCHYRVEKENQVIAVLPIGYCDGLHRHYSGRGSVLIGGKHAPMVGMICMDFMMVDISEIPEARVGDPVLIFGQNRHGHLLPLEGLASSGNSIAHELIACLGSRITRAFLRERSQKCRVHVL